MNETSHALLAPSDADRWANCPASPTMQALYPEHEPTDIQREGNACHWCAAEALKTGRKPDEYVGRLDPDGTEITPELASYAADYIDACLGIPAVFTGKAAVEHTLPPGRIHAQNWGTSDLWVFDERTGVLDVADGKFGFKVVEVVENWRLVNYAELVLSYLGVGLAEHIRVNLHVVQPRVRHREGPHRVWRAKASDLRPFVNRLEAAAAEATGPNPRAIAGEHCYQCKARHACEAAQRAALSAFEYVSTALPLNLTGSALGLELATMYAAQRAVKERLDGLEAEALGRIARGERVHGWATEIPPGRLVWNKPAPDVFAFGDMLGIDLRKAAEPVTPTQAKQKGLTEDAVNALSVRKNGSQKLVRESETLAYRAFHSGD